MLSSKKLGSWFAVIVLALVAVPIAARASDCPPPPEPPSAETIRQVAAQARDRGFLWKISKGGHDSWLYGTLHVGRLEWVAPGPKVRDALQRSDLLALELDLSNPMTMQRLGELSRTGAGQFPESLRGRLKAQLDSVCLPESVMNDVNPLLLLETVQLLRTRESGYEADYGVEAVLTSYAKAGEKKIVALETPELQMASIMSPDGKVGVEELDEGLKQLEHGSGADVVERLAKAWSHGALSELEGYEDWCQCMDTPIERAEMKKLLDDRNGPLASSVDALHAKGRAVFVAVGALHMIGPNGLPALLAARGYAVTPVTFSP